jgi:hypothetical protein
VGALDPSVRLTLLDPKLVELAGWQGCGRLVGPSVEEAIDVLKGLVAEVDDRHLTLLANRARKVAEGDGLALHLVAVEELTFYTNGPDRKAATAFSVLLCDAGGGLTPGGPDRPRALPARQWRAGPVCPLGRAARCAQHRPRRPGRRAVG